MTTGNVAFAVAASVAVISTLGAILGANAVHALLYLVLSLLSVAIIFFLLGAPFAAALEVIIYAGAIMVLFIFVIMMLNQGQQTIQQERKWLKSRMGFGPFFLGIILIGELLYVSAIQGEGLPSLQVVEPKSVGLALFGPYVLGVELASVLLLSGLVGAFFLGRKEE